jgi:hypothetical protein
MNHGWCKLDIFNKNGCVGSVKHSSRYQYYSTRDRPIHEKLHPFKKHIDFFYRKIQQQIRM